MDGIIGSMSGGIEAVVRRIRSRVPMSVLWAVLSAVWILLLVMFWPDSKPWEYVGLPTYLGVTILVSRFAPRRHQTWLPPLVGLSVWVPVVLTWKALS
jgi:hypothetical protein